jgi:multidrug resistance efflux pump
MHRILPAVAVILFAGSSPLSAQQDAWNSANAIRPDNSSLEIKQQVEISADIPGKIVQLEPSERGRIVKAGDIVVRLDSNVIEAEVAEARAKAESIVLIDYAQKTLDAAEQKLKTKQAANRRAIERTGQPVFNDDEILELQLDVLKSEAELAKSKEDQLFAQLSVKTLLARLEQYTVTAGIDGIVTDTHKKSIGSAVRQGDPILTVVNRRQLYARLAVKPQDESRINIGDKVLVRRETAESVNRAGTVFGTDQTTAVQQQPDSSPPRRTFTGVVSHIGGAEFDSQNTVYVWAVIDNVEVAPGRYLLREGSRIDARVLPSSSEQ